MKTMSIGDFKAQFSAVVDAVENGEEIIVEKGKGRKPVGVFIPMEKYQKPKSKRKLGILDGKATFKMRDDFKMTEEELLGE
ncbi:type II toxin-antitoxin system Phd/YefM family antitoxin [bacterium]|mgnify:CR=1 FL=1|nr:type II toxin-antitoxin system Phd/YefM family antitoxin [bacterium]MDA7863489.1 type II toxin-antitoxin system Phd/YefM family antitoxin [Akkermansiaceae bacterium]MDA7898550.1 type II toxin-antitoxin system Phd/YefM family antitoxin [bacterium]MDA7931658.1 type II toxin-antitoxin system Phd/YefM family antitoxin [Akkermansiaceae bacterium]MDA8968700.1 type II toxin-antitoxin system Phd/YefM family antitoxin [Akkermansiaceae bacterium]